MGNRMNPLQHSVTETIHFGRPFEKEDFHICLTGTGDYIPNLGILACSIAEHNKDLPLAFHFFVDQLSEEEKGRIEEFVRETTPRRKSPWEICPVEVHLLDISTFDSLLLADKKAGYFFRLVIPPTLEPITDKALYLDGDMLCRGSLKELAEMDMTGIMAAVVSDRGEEHHRQMVHTERYFNSGMMLFNIKDWMKENLFDDIVGRAMDRAAKKEKAVRLHDQDILNEMLDGRCHFIDKKYNYLYNLDLQSLFKKQPHNEDYKKQVILHFAGHTKQWHSWVQDWDVVKEYLEIKKNSPWKEFSVVEPKTHKHLHQAARTARMNGKYCEMLGWYWKYFRNK